MHLATHAILYKYFEILILITLFEDLNKVRMMHSNLFPFFSYLLPPPNVGNIIKLAFYKLSLKDISYLYFNILDYIERVISNIYSQFSLGSHFGAIKWGKHISHIQKILNGKYLTAGQMLIIGERIDGNLFALYK